MIEYGLVVKKLYDVQKFTKFWKKKNQKIGGLRQFSYLKNKYSNIQIKALFLKGYSGIRIIKFGFVVKKLCFI